MESHLRRHSDSKTVLLLSFYPHNYCKQMVLKYKEVSSVKFSPSYFQFAFHHTNKVQNSSRSFLTHFGALRAGMFLHIEISFVFKTYVKLSSQIIEADH